MRRRLAEQSVKPWQRKMWCIPHVDTKYVARMEDVLDLYTDTPDPRRPVVCFDETPMQLIGETRLPWPTEPGKPARIDYEYRRNATANLFVFLDAHQPWRHVKVTERKTAHDFAHCMRELVDVHYPGAETVRVVFDNLISRMVSARIVAPGSTGVSVVQRCVVSVRPSVAGPYPQRQRPERRELDRQHPYVERLLTSCVEAV